MPARRFPPPWSALDGSLAKRQAPIVKTIFRRRFLYCSVEADARLVERATNAMNTQGCDRFVKGAFRHRELAVSNADISARTARLIRAATVSGLSIAMSDRSSVPSMIILPGSFCNTEQSRLDCAVSMEICCTGDSANSGRNE